MLPDNAICCGLAPPLSVMETAPLPTVCAFQWTVIVQDCDGPSVDGQLLFCEKPWPLTVMLVMVSAVLPTLVRIVDCGGGGQLP